MPVTFYATIDADSVRPYMPPVPVLLPASSWWRRQLRPPRLPSHLVERAGDCGAYQAARAWGGYPYTPGRYVAWLASFAPRWAATMDACCADLPAATRPVVVRERQDATTALARHLWERYSDTPWAWVPTIQGWEVADYRRHARDLRPLIERMRDRYAGNPAWRVGVGSLCRRADPHLIHAIGQAVAEVLPGVPLHLWGVKLRTLNSPLGLPPAVVSVDSAAWHGLFGRGLEAWRDSGLTRRRYAYGVALPAYLAKVDAALTTPKQPPLPWSDAPDAA